MLALKTTRLPPTLVSTTAARWKSACVTTVIAPLNTQPTPNTSASSGLLRKENHVSAQRNFIIPPVIAPFPLPVVRYYSNQPSAPAPPNLPDKEQLLKIFFRILAYVWDISYWLFTWVRKIFMEQVVENPTVQLYFNKLRERMEQAKKD